MALPGRSSTCPPPGAASAVDAPGVSSPPHPTSSTRHAHHNTRRVTFGRLIRSLRLGYCGGGRDEHHFDRRLARVYRDEDCAATVIEPSWQGVCRRSIPMSTHVVQIQQVAMKSL